MLQLTQITALRSSFLSRTIDTDMNKDLYIKSGIDEFIPKNRDLVATCLLSHDYRSFLAFSSFLFDCDGVNDVILSSHRDLFINSYDMYIHLDYIAPSDYMVFIKGVGFIDRY